VPPKLVAQDTPAKSVAEAVAEDEPAAPVGAKKEKPAAAPAAPEPDPGALLAARETPPERAPAARRPAGSPADRSRRLGRPATSAAKAPTPAARAPQPEPEGGFLDGLPAPFNQPLILAGIGLGVLFAIVFTVLRRRGSAEREEPITPFAAGEPFSVDEQAQVEEGAESVEKPEAVGLDAEAEVAPEAAEGEPSLFDQPVEEEEPSVEEEEPPEVAEEVPVAAATPPPLVPSPSEELEQRLGQLEARLEEIVDEKDRLGRQVAAQTEELRVQRAAIARTQRVLRDLSRPADEATEPVPKG
jgi:hypothetical protein